MNLSNWLHDLKSTEEACTTNERIAVISPIPKTSMLWLWQF